MSAVSVEFGVSKLSVAFVNVPSFVHNNSIGTFVSGFYNYILSLFKLAYGLSFSISKIIMKSSGFTLSKMVFRACSLSLGVSKYFCYGKECRVH